MPCVKCNWDDMVAEEGITLEKWRKKALKRAARVGRIRAELRESGVDLAPEVRVY
jgi:hypothetical protein